MTELDPRERELAETLRQTLEQSAARPDPLMDAALAATRAQIAARAQKPRRHPWMLVGGFALAASLAAVLVMPSLMNTPTSAARPATVAASAAAMPDADLQMLQDMDMLAAMSTES
ncbi:MAG: hypothetical protein ACRERR_06465 [Moraxellaceae bacterium]